jgi:hypothetical protein
MSGSARSSMKGQRVGGARTRSGKKGIDKVDYLMFGVLLSVLTCEFLAFMKYKGYSNKITWMLVLLPLYMAVAMSSLLLHFLYLSSIKSFKLKMTLYFFKFITVKSYLSLLTIKSL